MATDLRAGAVLVGSLICCGGFWAYKGLFMNKCDIIIKGKLASDVGRP